MPSQYFLIGMVKITIVNTHKTVEIPPKMSKKHGITMVHIRRKQMVHPKNQWGISNKWR